MSNIYYTWIQIPNNQTDYLTCTVWVVLTNNNVANNNLKKDQLTSPQVKQFIQSHINIFIKINIVLATIPYRYDKAEKSK